MIKGSDMLDLNKYKGDIYRIIGDAFDVYREYHGGLQESAYEAALCYVLRSDKFIVDRQKPLSIYYKGVRLDQTYRLDIVVNNEIILELKATEALTKEHRLQLFNYLRLTHAQVGLLINFTIHDRVQCEKYYYDEEKNECFPF